MTNKNDTYNIKLPQFEGPFDLLLFFIERDELDIYDIPIANITNDFLDYLKGMQQKNIDLASEFILVAATLMRIKAKMLIPRKAVDESGNEIDPRQELVDRLLEYKRYKNILDEMRTLEEDRVLRNVRGNVSNELKLIATKALVDVELESVTLFKLLKTFERILYRLEQSKKVIPIHKVVPYNYSVLDQQTFIIALLDKKEKVDFIDVFGQCKDRIHAIVTFLAMLELLNLQKITLLQGEGINNFWITHSTDTTTTS